MIVETGPAVAERYRAARRDPSMAVLEGLHALKHAIRFGARLLEARSPDPVALRTLAEELAPDVAHEVAHRTTQVPATLFAELAPSPHPTGVIALARRPRVDAAAALAAAGSAPAVLLERPTHHGNIGAIVRVAAAAGAAAVLTTGPHDPWHPAALRGGAGLQFALPVARLADAAAAAEGAAEGVPAELAASDRPLVVLDPDGEPFCSPGVEASGPGAADGIPPRPVLVFGSERSGVSAALRARADAVISIPMREGVSSLNLATAVAVVLYGMGAPFEGGAPAGVAVP